MTYTLTINTPRHREALRKALEFRLADEMSNYEAGLVDELLTAVINLEEN